MSKFNGNLTVTKIGGRFWRVAQGFSFISDKFEPVEIPQGFDTDFASIPRAVWWILPPDGQYSQAACLHDFLYQKRKDLTFEGPKRSRKECDQIFLEAMKTLGVGYFTRYAMYNAVRFFGGFH